MATNCNCDIFDGPTIIDPSGFLPPSGWSDCAVTVVRALIGDTSLLYTDDRIFQLINAAAVYVLADLTCCTVVSRPIIDICTGSASADPSQYPGFFALLTLKAACLFDQGNARSQSQTQGVKAVCGPATLQIASSSSSFSTLFSNGPCMAYKELKEDLCFRCPIQSASCMSQILGPFISDSFRWCNSRPNNHCGNTYGC